MNRRTTITHWNFRLGQISYVILSHYICGGEGGYVKRTLIVSCLEWLTCLFLFIMVEFEKLLYSPDLKMVQCSNEFLSLSHEILCHAMVGDKVMW